VSRVDQALCLGLRNDTLRRRMNDTGINPDHIDQAVLVERIRGDTARCGQGIR
jgi:hypothetical protein